MRFLTMQRPALASMASLSRALPSITPAPRALPLWAASTAVQGHRYASVKAQGAYKKKSKRGIPKKLGAKRTGDQFVIPGNILYKQRGTLWWPGENCMMGRDHTIHSKVTGYVKYYRDPAKHPDRKYIGVVFDKNDTLPYPVHAQRKRRLNMTESTIREAPERPTAESESGIPYQVTRVQAGEPDRLLRLRDDYSYREDNWQIGRLVDTTNIRLTRFRTRKQWFRQRRWRKEREITGRIASEKKRAESGAADPSKKGGKAKKAGKKAEKKKAKK